MRIILIVLSCLCLQSEGYTAGFQELGIIAKSGLRLVNPTSFRSFSTINERVSNFASTSTEEEKWKLAHLVKTYDMKKSGMQQPRLQDWLHGFHHFTQQTTSNIRMRHEINGQIDTDFREVLKKTGKMNSDGEDFANNSSEETYLNIFKYLGTCS